jgi:hypothetical protein
MRRHWEFSITTISLLAGFGLGACGSDAGAPPVKDAATSEAATSVQPVDSSADGAGNAPSGIVVVNSIYGDSTSISFLDRDGNVVRDGCFNSGTGATGATPTLSGDVVLPTQVPLGGPVPIIDRDRGYNTLTWLDPATCTPLRQLGVGTGFYSNPHDVVTLSASKAYVTRNNENGAATLAPNDFDDGDDLLIIDPTQPKILGRIDLKPFAPVGVLPCADRALLAEGTVFVSLNAISLDFATYGTGRIVMVNPVTDQVTGVIDLPGAKNCGALTYLAAERTLMVACTGSYSDPQQADTSAIVTIDLGVSPPAVIAQVAATSVGGFPFTNATLAALDGQAAFAVTFGDTSNAPDRLWSLPLNGTMPVKVFDSSEAFSMGAVLADSRNSRVLVTDGTSKAPAFLRFFDYSAGTFTAGKTVQTNPKKNLPPHALAFY